MDVETGAGTEQAQVSLAPALALALACVHAAIGMGSRAFSPAPLATVSATEVSSMEGRKMLNTQLWDEEERIRMNVHAWESDFCTHRTLGRRAGRWKTGRWGSKDCVIRC